MQDAKITLTNSLGLSKYYESTTDNIPSEDNLRTADVQVGSWIIQNNVGNSWDDGNYKLMLDESHKYVPDFGKPIMRVVLVEYNEQGICLFGKNHYFGNTKVRI
jgi:hypothetical protein